MDFYRAKLSVHNFNGKGRGLVANEDIFCGNLIERSPIMVVPPQRFKTISNPKHGLGPLMAHMVIWKKDEEFGDDTACMVFGLSIMCNHSDNPNASFRMEYEEDTLALIANTNIIAGEEITIRYKHPEIISIQGW